MNPVTLVSGFIPLVLFGLLNGPVPLAAAAAIGAAASVIIALITIRRGTAALAIVQAIALAAFSVTAATSSPETLTWLGSYGLGIPSLALAAYMLLTAPFAPFTAAYARASVPRQAWGTPRFTDTNRRISAAWGVTVLILGLSHLATAAIGTSALPRFQAHLAEWGPAVVAAILAIRYTRRTITRAHDAPAAAPHPESGYQPTHPE